METYLLDLRVRRTINLSRKPAPGREARMLVNQQGIAGDLGIPYFWVIAELPAVARCLFPMWKQPRGKGDL